MEEKEHYNNLAEIFRTENEALIGTIIRTRMEEYAEQGGTITEPKKDEAYLRLIVHYLLRERPSSDYSVDNMMKLMGASYSDAGDQTPFWVIIRGCMISRPADEVYVNARSLEKEMGDQDIDELFAFLEFEILHQEERTLLEKSGTLDVELGALRFNRICYRRKKMEALRAGTLERRQTGSINRKGRGFPGFGDGDTRKKMDALRRECKRFLQEYTPEKIKAYLDRFVIGQDETKEFLGTAVYNHYLRIAYPEKKLIKTNVLMIGPSGCGKTELIRRIDELIQLPVVITDFSGVVATPWRGRNKEEALQNLYLRAGRVLPLAECGIVFCDEFDKVVPTRRNDLKGDINDELQGQLLGMFEGTQLDVPIPREKGGTESICMDTSNILFVCAGAFEGLEKIVRKDVVNGGIGFGREVDRKKELELTADVVKTKHLISYGMKPELAGRLHCMTVLSKLDRDMLYRVLTEAEDGALTRYKNEFRAEDGVELRFEDGALDVIVDQVMNMRIGARGINAVIRDMLKEALYEVPGREDVHEVIITRQAALGEEKPVYH